MSTGLMVRGDRFISRAVCDSIPYLAQVCMDSINLRPS